VPGGIAGAVGQLELVGGRLDDFVLWFVDSFLGPEVPNFGELGCGSSLWLTMAAVAGPASHRLDVRVETLPEWVLRRVGLERWAPRQAPHPMHVVEAQTIKLSSTLPLSLPLSLAPSPMQSTKLPIGIDPFRSDTA